MKNNNKFKLLSVAVAASILVSNAFAEVEVSGKFTHETGRYTESGYNIGADATGGPGTHAKDIFKNENILRLFVDGDVPATEDGSTFHLELQGMTDNKASYPSSNFDENESYTQRDLLREGYIDTSVNDWNLRLGKQQVVWGTADGMKLLDMINPTDYSEMAQNQMEDSRIPVWMINTEKTFDKGGNLQFIVSEAKENIFPGLDRNINTTIRDNNTRHLPTNTSDWGTPGEGHGYRAAMDTTDVSNADSVQGHASGHPFILKGVDSITGKSNGFLNIVPDLGSVASRFYNEFCQNPVANCAALAGFNNMTVGQFANLTDSYISSNFAVYSNMKAFADAGLDGAGILNGFASAYDTNLSGATSAANWRSVVDSTFEYMDNATFATFDAFAGAQSIYKYDMPDNEANYSLRYSDALEDGTNYSLNYSYAYDKNPIINLSWRDPSTMAKLKQNYSNGIDGSGNMTTSISLTNQAGTSKYGAFGSSGTTAGDAALLFEQTVERVHNIGGSFDTTIETETLGPVVIRGEALYQKDTYSPVMDLTALSIGDMVNALVMEKGDRFKYVIGADITALTNMMISLQFIQDRNLDFVDTQSVIAGNADISSRGRYTTDYATMSLKNQFNRAEENKDFYSLYLSKPFGASDQHRWNNIFIFEENGGKWNRLDVEYTINDNTIATAEYNKYWGNENTQFGQLEKSSNVQLGFKYTF